MARNNYKIGIILIIATFGSASAEDNEKTCNTYNYVNPVDNKPDLITINFLLHSICRISPNVKIAIDSAKNYEDLNEAESLPFRNSLNPDAPDLGYWQFHGLGYDLRDNTVYYSRNRFGVYKAQLNMEHRERIFQMTNETLRSMGATWDIAYDWATGNLYVLFQQALVVLDTKKLSQWKTLLVHDNDYWKIRVHPNRGYLFLLHYPYFDDGENVISRSHLDGTNLQVVLNFTEPYSQTSPIPHPSIQSLAVDLYEDRLYWTMSLSKRLVRHSKLNGSDLQTLYEESAVGANAIAVDKDYVYYNIMSNNLTNFIIRTEKATGRRDDKFTILNMQDATNNIYVLDKEAQKTREDHPCKLNNGGCNEFCFAVPDGEDKLKKLCG